MMKLSIVISAFNEQENITDCLNSVRWADEIIIIDNESTDNTKQIAQKVTNNLFSKKNNPLRLNENKNFGFTKATSDWILSLDADERVGRKLKQEIQELINENNNESNGYLIPRKNIIFGKWIRHGLWYPDYQLRLFRKGKGKFPNKHNHELLEVEGKTEKLANHLIHYNYKTISQYIKKINDFYSDNEAEQYFNSRKKLEWFDAIRMPTSDFLSNFFAREGYKDGLHGLVLAILQSFYTFVVFAKVWEKQGFWEYNNQNFLQDTKIEFQKKGRELSYWILKVRENDSTGLHRYFLKLKRKLKL